MQGWGVDCYGTGRIVISHDKVYMSKLFMCVTTLRWTIKPLQSRLPFWNRDGAEITEKKPEERTA